MTSPLHKEITELHEFFQEWFQGTVPDRDMSRMETALHEDFTWISPWGMKLNREELIQRVAPVYGSRPGMVITIRDVQETALSDTHVLATYEEHQRHEALDMGRISTGVFLKDGEAPNGWVWLHIQETMLPSSSGE